MDGSTFVGIRAVVSESTLMGKSTLVSESALVGKSTKALLDPSKIL